MKPRTEWGQAALLSICLVGSAEAQTVARVAPIPGAVKHAGTYHVATQEWTRGQQTYGVLMQDALYRNDLGSNYFGLLDQSEIYHHAARLPGDGSPLAPGGFSFGTADAYTVSGFHFGYCALNAHPVAYTLGFLNSYAACSDPLGLPVVTSFTTTSLPSNGCWTIAFDISGTSAQFTLESEGGDGSWDNKDDLDTFGMFVSLDGGQGDGTGQVTHGPIFAGNLNNASRIGDGTIFQNPTVRGVGLGTASLFWLMSPTVADGCYFYSSEPHNLETVLYGSAFEDPVSTFCAPGNPNSVSTTGARLSSLGGFGSDQSTFWIRDVPAQPGILITGPNQTQIPFGCGNRCVIGPGVVRFGPFNSGAGAASSFQVSIDMSRSTNANVQYWCRDPVNAPICGAPFNLSNGVGL